MVPKEIIQIIKNNKNFLLTTHQNLEGDALGSVLAMRDLLLSLKKKVDIVIQDNIPAEYRFLPGLNYIKDVKQVDFSRYDVLIALDVSEKQRCAKVMEAFPRNRLIANIDHHISNSRFGNINWVNPKASSAVEMVYYLYHKLNIPLNKKRALWLYVGLLTDTGCFRYPNTNRQSFALAEKLVSFGLNVNEIYKKIYYNLAYFEVKMLSEILKTIKSACNNRIVWFKIKRDIFVKINPNGGFVDLVLDLGRQIKDAQVVVLFKEDFYKKDTIHINLRSKNKVDVDKIARYFGGGGHRSASGCRIKGKLKDIENKVIQKIKEYIK